MKKSIKFILIILIIFGYALFISTFTFVLMSRTNSPALFLGIGTISLCMCILLNAEIIKHETPREIEDDETFSEF